MAVFLLFFVPSRRLGNEFFVLLSLIFFLLFDLFNAILLGYMFYYVFDFSLVFLIHSTRFPILIFVYQHIPFHWLCVLRNVVIVFLSELCCFRSITEHRQNVGVKHFALCCRESFPSSQLRQSLFPLVIS